MSVNGEVKYGHAAAKNQDRVAVPSEAMLL